MGEKFYRVAGYVKLAKLWEKHSEQARKYHKKYYVEKFATDEKMILCDVYIDITGQKEIYKRSEMVRLLRDCMAGKVDCIAAQTKGYFAANTQELCYLLKFIFDLPYDIELITEDSTYRIDTIESPDDQRSALKKMADDYAELDSETYKDWKQKVLDEISAIT